MSYYFRDKPRFSDRLRSGNSGVGDDDLMESLKRQFDQDSKTFFEPTSSPTANNRTSRERESPFDHRHIGFSRGFPFDDDGFDVRRGGGNIRSHLDDLAARHPEFADQLLGPPWGDAPFLSTPRNRRRGSGLGSYQGNVDDDTRSQASGSSAASAASGASGVSSHGEPGEQYSGRNIHQEPQVNVKEQRRNQIPQYGLRNTVDIGQHRHNMDNNEKVNRGQRSASAPPENRQTPQNFEPQQPQTQNQRFVSRVDITPQQQDANKPPVSPKASPQAPPQAQSQPQSNQQKNQHGNVRHIPIFVEGRDEPVVPKNVEEPVFPQQQQRPQSPPHFHRPSHFNQHFANSRQQPQQQWPPHYYQQHEQQPQTQKPNHYQQQQEQYRQQQAEKQKAQQQQQQQRQHQQQQQEQEAEPPKLKQIQPKEPLERVALVQQEVDSLMEQVKLYNGNSRQAKDYMYLDEMLTRELIKLDDIETEGKPNVRQARKEAIKSIQDCIALLESKVPLPGQEAQKSSGETEQPALSMETEATPAEAEVPEVIPTVPIPLPPPAPATEQNPVKSAPADELMPSTDNSTQAAGTAMETQQDVEGQKRQAEPSNSLNTGERGSQQMDVDGNSKGSKSPRKERKTVTPKPVSEEPIPLPAPEVCHT